MKKPFSCLLEEEVIAEIKRRAVGDVSQAEAVRRAIFGEAATVQAPAQGQVGGQMEDRLKNVEAMVGRLVETMDRLVDLMVVAEMDQAASELAEPKVSQEGARPPYPPEYTPGGALAEPKKLVDEAPAGVKTIDPRSLGLTPEQVKSFGLKTGADLEPKVEEELPDDPQTPVPPEEDPPMVGQVGGPAQGRPGGGSPDRADDRHTRRPPVEPDQEAEGQTGDPSVQPGEDDRPVYPPAAVEAQR